jgi:hypothetical protein
MPRWMIRQMGPVTMLFIWWKGHQWAAPIDWPVSSETKSGRWSW